ncbi:cobaltochelatase CobT-related protein [Thioclava sp. FR2]|uniref:cobaltochelatase CobT-related protein n=1 Tax=Thioclava sp. FR2 TaxID=3445780 RepID=UPI003EC117FE
MKFNWPWKRDEDTSSYRIFTTEYDVTCTGDELWKNMNSDQRAAWTDVCAVYESEFAVYRSKSSLLGAKWLDKLKSDGLAGPDQVAVAILIDHSGSMKGQRAAVACLLTELIADFLHRVGVAYEILGFTTHSWKGGNSRKKWVSVGRRPNPGRLADLLHIIYRHATDSVPGAPYAVRHLLRNDLLKENIDGEALFWAGQRLMDLGRSRNIVIIVSDGAPVEDSTLDANHPTILWDHLKAVIADLEATPGFSLIGVGIDYDLSALYPTNCTIDRLDGMAEAVLPILVSELIHPR